MVDRFVIFRVVEVVSRPFFLKPPTLYRIVIIRSMVIPTDNGLGCPGGDFGIVYAEPYELGPFIFLSLSIR